MESSEENRTRATITNQKFEVICIKEELVEENSQDRELYKNVLHSVKKEECITDDEGQSDKYYDKLITINNDIRCTENSNTSNDQNFEVYIKEETLEETSQDCESYENVLQSEKEDSWISKIIKTKSKICALCNKSFKGRCDLIMHMKTHEGIKKFSCPICYKLFLRNGDVAEHIKIHSCSTCGKTFKLQERLELHMKLHTEIREYQCPICHKIFKRNSYLKVHLKIHSGVKDHICTICNKQFSQGSSLCTHTKIHAETGKCPICGLLCRTNAGLRSHMNVHKNV